MCGKNQGTSSMPIDEGDELFSCDGDEIDVSVEVNGERSDDEFSDEGNSRIEKSAEEATGNNGNDSDQRHAPSESPSIIPLAPLCESEELKGDATFLMSLGYYCRKKKPPLDSHLKSQASRNNTLLQEEISRSVSNWKKIRTLLLGRMK